MNMQTIYQPLPPRVTQILHFLNATVGLVSATLLAQGHDTAAAYTALGAGVINTAVNVFIGQNPNSHNEKVSVDSTLSNRRERMQKKAKGATKRRPAEGGAE